MFYRKGSSYSHTHTHTSMEIELKCNELILTITRNIQHNLSAKQIDIPFRMQFVLSTTKTLIVTLLSNLQCFGSWIPVSVTIMSVLVAC